MSFVVRLFSKGVTHDDSSGRLRPDRRQVGAHRPRRRKGRAPRRRLERIRTCRQMLEEKIQAHEIMYGVNTGIGEFSEVVLTDEQVQQFQRYLIYNHAAGIGEPAPIEYVRGAMAGRINVHAHGNSGCRPEITADPGRDAEQGRHAGGVPEGLGGRLRRPGADGPDGAAADGRGRGLLPGRAPAGPRGDGAGRHPHPRPAGPRRAGGDQRLEPADRHERHPPVRHEPLAEAGRDRLRHEPGGAAAPT